MKKLINVLSVILIIISAANVLAGCRRTDDGKNDTKDFFSDIESYTIIRPDNAKEYERKLAVEFKKQISERYGIDLQISTDWIGRDETLDKNAHEILIGETARAESAAVYSSFGSKTDAYYVGNDGNKLIIAGDSMLSLNYAFVLFSENYMKEDKIDLPDNFAFLSEMSESELEFIKEYTGAPSYTGKTDTLDEDDKTHGNYTLKWSEEFSGDKIDKSIWNYQYGYVANNELQCYTDSERNSYIDSDCLVITALEENKDGFNYTSARLNTQNKFSFRYGYIEMSAILPKGQGMWPAFWMMGSSGSWPACGEIDIMEMIGGSGRDNTVHGTLHWGTSNPYNHMNSNLNSYTSTKSLSEDFHTYGVEWTEDRIKWYIDGKMFCQIDVSGAHFNLLHQNFYILINLAVGGDWPGSPDATTVFPQQYVIDYIRVYQ